MTAIAEVPDAVRGLIAERLDSVAELEAILLLRQHQPQQWSADDAGKRLYVSTTVAAHILTTLAQRGLLQRSGTLFAYSPESSELSAAVDLLATAYSEHLIAVTRLIHEKPGASVRAFGDAFRLKKGD